MGNGEKRLYNNSNKKGCGAAYIVAASDASDEAKARANFICDGIDDQEEIEKAHNRLYESGGGVVTLSAGTFSPTARFVWRSGVSCFGQGAGATKIQPIGEDIGSFFRDDDSRAPDNATKDVIFADFEIDCSRETQSRYSTGNKGLFFRYMERCHLLRLYVRNTLATGIGVDFLKNGSSITHCVVENAGRGNGGRMGGGNGIGIGIGKSEVEDVLIAYNTVKDTKRFGIMVEKQDEEGPDSRGIRVVGNYATGCEAGFHDSGAFGAVFLGNIARANRDGFYIGRGTVSVSRAGVCGIIASNIIESNTRYGIKIQPDEENRGIDWLITGNRISDNGSAGIKLGRGAYGIAIKGNVGYTTENSGTAGVYGVNTAVEVEHGLHISPQSKDIHITPLSRLVNASKFWVSDVGAKTFVINVDVAPGNDAEDRFAWKAEA